MHGTGLFKDAGELSASLRIDVNLVGNVCDALDQLV
jgi:hypothetical protein